MIESNSDTIIYPDDTERQLPVFSEIEISGNITSGKHIINEEVFSKYFFGELMAHVLSIDNIDDALTVQYNMQSILNIINTHTEKLQKEYDDKFFKEHIRQKANMIRETV